MSPLIVVFDAPEEREAAERILALLA